MPSRLNDKFAEFETWMNALNVDFKVISSPSYEKREATEIMSCGEFKQWEMSSGHKRQFQAETMFNLEDIS